MDETMKTKMTIIFAMLLSVLAVSCGSSNLSESNSSSKRSKDPLARHLQKMIDENDDDSEYYNKLMLSMKKELTPYSKSKLEAHKKAYNYIKDHPEEFKRDFGDHLDDNLDPQQKRLLIDFAYVQVMMVGVIGVIAALPEDVSNWNKSELAETSLGDRWTANVKKGPVIDHDDWAINYIGHPVSGSWYYTWGRSRGLDWKGSFALSTLMSSFFWEYGYEAFAEVPSIQDLILTPLIGALIGELTYGLYLKIDENDGKLNGSRTLGNIVKILVNPIGEANKALERSLEPYFENIEVNSKMYLENGMFDPNRPEYYSNDRVKSNAVRINFELKF